MVVLDRLRKGTEKTFGIKFDKVLDRHERELIEKIFIACIAGTISGLIIRQATMAYLQSIRSVQFVEGCSTCGSTSSIHLTSYNEGIQRL